MGTESTLTKTPKMDYSAADSTFASCFAREGKMVGFYTQRERRNKIYHYRAKVLRRKFFVPVIKEFAGRSMSARVKPRKCGKFVKTELGHLYELTEEQKLERTQTIDSYLNQHDYESAITYLIEY